MGFKFLKYIPVHYAIARRISAWLGQAKFGFGMCSASMGLEEAPGNLLGESTLQQGDNTNTSAAG